MSLNRLQLQAVLIQREELRYSPAGIPVLGALFAHGSEQTEAGMQRKIELEISVLFAGKLAEAAARLNPGVRLNLAGFMAARRRQSKSLVLHVTEFELIEV